MLVSQIREKRGCSISTNELELQWIQTKDKIKTFRPVNVGPQNTKQPCYSKEWQELLKLSSFIVTINTDLTNIMCVCVCVITLFQTNSKFKHAYNCLYASYTLKSMYQTTSWFSHHWKTTSPTHTSTHKLILLYVGSLTQPRCPTHLPTCPRIGITITSTHSQAYKQSIVRQSHMIEVQYEYMQTATWLLHSFSRCGLLDVPSTEDTTHMCIWYTWHQIQSFIFPRLTLTESTHGYGVLSHSM